MKSVCVFLGANMGSNPIYAEQVQVLGQALAQRGLTCIYGGSDSGLMKLLADSALAAGGQVIGVTVQALKDKEIYHSGLTKLHVVQSMHERKALMAELSDGFIAYPGGIGTFEEFFEVYTWAKLGFHQKPCGLLNINGYYDAMDRLLDKAEQEGFLSSEDQKLLLRADSPAGMLDQMSDFYGLQSHM